MFYFMSLFFGICHGIYRDEGMRKESAKKKISPEEGEKMNKK